VNAALKDLPIGKLSGILEGPDSFHIVRVDRRRAAGPAPFEELQDEIRTKILNQKFQAAREEYMKKLRDETPVDTFHMNDMERPPSGGPT
jgi:peptidyl-prolyl cis-trans isomerase SurA